MNSHSSNASAITDFEISQLPPPPKEWLEDIKREEQEIINDFYYNYDELWKIILTEKERLEEVDKIKEEEEDLYRQLYTKMNNTAGIKKVITVFKDQLDELQEVYEGGRNFKRWRKMKKVELVRMVLDKFMKYIKEHFEINKTVLGWGENASIDLSYINRIMNNYRSWIEVQGRLTEFGLNTNQTLIIRMCGFTFDEWLSEPSIHEYLNL